MHTSWGIWTTQVVPLLTISLQMKMLRRSALACVSSRSEHVNVIDVNGPEEQAADETVAEENGAEEGVANEIVADVVE